MYSKIKNGSNRILICQPILVSNFALDSLNRKFGGKVHLLPIYRADSKKR